MLDAIIEGPAQWPVRPAMEVFHERDFGTARTFPGLVGLIWQLRDDLAVDAAPRGARVITFSFPAW